MSRDTGLKFAIISLVGLLGAVLLGTCGLSFPISELAGPIGVVATLGPCAAFYHRRQTSQFVMTLMALIQLLVFTSCFTVAMYGAASLGAPLADDILAAADKAIGLHVPSIVKWAGEHQQVNQLLMLAYHSVILQTLVIVLFLGFTSQRRPLESFVLRYIICLVITLPIFAALPAECPFSYFHFAPSPQQVHYLEHLHGFRSGERTIVSLVDCEGLVTFPSFHTSFAILLTSVFWGRWRLFIPFAILNSAVIVATVTSGWHYGIDIIGGVATVMVTILITNRLQSWLYATNPSVHSTVESYRKTPKLTVGEAT